MLLRQYYVWHVCRSRSHLKSITLLVQNLLFLTSRLATQFQFIADMRVHSCCYWHRVDTNRCSRKRRCTTADITARHWSDPEPRTSPLHDMSSQNTLMLSSNFIFQVNISKEMCLPSFCMQSFAVLYQQHSELIFISDFAVLANLGYLSAPVYTQLKTSFFPCGAAAQRGQWPPQS